MLPLPHVPWQAAAPRAWRYRERECLEAGGGGRGRGRGREGRRGRVQGKTSRLKTQTHRCISILPAICTHRNFLLCWQFLLVREVDVVPAPRCRCSSCLGRSTQILHPRESCPARVDKLLPAAWRMEQKAGELDIWQAFHVCPRCLEDVCCALLGSILVPRTRCSSQCWDVSEEEPAGGLRV